MCGVMHRGTWKWLSTVHFFALLLLSSAPSSQLMTRTTHHMLLLYVHVILWMFLLHISLLVPCYISNIGLCRTDGLTDMDRQTQGHSIYAIYARWPGLLVYIGLSICPLQANVVSEALSRALHKQCLFAVSGFVVSCQRYVEIAIERVAKCTWSGKNLQLLTHNSIYKYIL